MKEYRVFVNDEGMAIFTCPNCETANPADVQKFKHIRSSVRLKVRCVCGHTYKAILERRRFYRKLVSLAGTFSLESRPGKEGMEVVDVSMTGLKFKPKSRISLKSDDRIAMEFRLDDAHATPIQRKGVIRSVAGNVVGVEFTDMNSANAYDKALGFYLMRQGGG